MSDAPRPPPAGRMSSGGAHVARSASMSSAFSRVIPPIPIRSYSTICPPKQNQCLGLESQNQCNTATLAPEASDNDSVFESPDEMLAREADRETEYAGECVGLSLSRTRTKASSARGEDEKGKDPYLITLEGMPESLNPHYWNVKYRWALTGLSGLMVLNATFASSAPSNLIPDIVTHYHTSSILGVLTISIFVAGYCLGPLIFGPLSERYGRRNILIYSFIPYALFQIGCALAPNIAALLVFRFLAGCFASSPLTASGALIADLWDADRRGDAMSIFSVMPTAGPALAPIISGYFHVVGVDWQWIFWLLFIFAGVCWLLMVFLLPETFIPYILVIEAKRKRKETGDYRYHASLETKAGSFSDLIKMTILKPFIMIIQEPMLLVLTLYLAFVYGVIYLLFEAVPIIFMGIHGLNAGECGLVFLSVFTGSFIGCVIHICYFNPRYKKEHERIKKEGKFMVPPEFRLIPLMYAAPALVVAFFWVAFTSYRSISIASPILALTLFGICVLFIFLSVFNYLIDTYLANAASALAINTVVRSAFGAGFPMFTKQMYTRLGVVGASGLLAGIAVVFLPIPFLLFKYGKRIRGLSKNAHVMD